MIQGWALVREIVLRPDFSATSVRRTKIVMQADLLDRIADLLLVLIQIAILFSFLCGPISLYLLYFKLLPSQRRLFHMSTQALADLQQAASDLTTQASAIAQGFTDLTNAANNIANAITALENLIKNGGVAPADVENVVASLRAAGSSLAQSATGFQSVVATLNTEAQQAEQQQQSQTQPAQSATSAQAPNPAPAPTEVQQ